MVGLLFIGRPVQDWRYTDPCLFCCRSTVVAALPGWDCGNVVRAGWIAWQALVQGGRRPGKPEGQEEL